MSEENKPLGFEKMDTDDVEQVSGGSFAFDDVMKCIRGGDRQLAMLSYRALKLVMDDYERENIKYIFRQCFGCEIE